MRLFLLTALTMAAFAANSLLNRAALAGGGDPMTFALLRLAAGSVALALLVAITRRGFAVGGRRRALGAGTLLLYLFGFSYAYLALDAGLGALVLFGVVQLTMFAGAFLSGERFGVRNWLGTALALAGLGWLTWPGGLAPQSPVHVLSMVLAGLGWGLYSLSGRAEADPLQATAMNFLLAVPAGAAIWLLAGTAAPITPAFAGWALLSGVVTSGLGYALWYSVLPGLGASRAAVAQLTVPVIALAGGVLLLAEPAAPRTILAAALVLGGVALALRRPGSAARLQRSSRSSGS